MISEEVAPTTDDGTDLAPAAGIPLMVQRCTPTP
jgi:hypothetical protein